MTKVIFHSQPLLRLDCLFTPFLFPARRSADSASISGGWPRFKQISTFADPKRSTFRCAVQKKCERPSPRFPSGISNQTPLAPNRPHTSFQRLGFIQTANFAQQERVVCQARRHSGMLRARVFSRIASGLSKRGCNRAGPVVQWYPAKTGSLISPRYAASGRQETPLSMHTRIRGIL